MPNNKIATKRTRVRLFTIAYLAFLITASSTVIPTYAPTRPLPAEADIEPRAYARALAETQYGWGSKQFTCLSRLWGKESAWNHLADNPQSSAFGIAQMLGEKSTNPETQIRNGLRYIQHRYDNPCNAWDFWQRNYWY